MGIELGRDNACYIHLTLVPYIASAGEIKTKPTQHSVKELREIGIQPDVAAVPRATGRCPTTSAARSRSSPTSPVEAVISALRRGLDLQDPGHAAQPGCSTRSSAASSS